MSFPIFRFKELVEEDWGKFHILEIILRETRFLFGYINLMKMEN